MKVDLVIFMMSCFGLIFILVRIVSMLVVNDGDCSCMGEMLTVTCVFGMVCESMVRLLSVWCIMCLFRVVIRL